MEARNLVWRTCFHKQTVGGLSYAFIFYFLFIWTKHMLLSEKQKQIFGNGSNQCIWQICKTISENKFGCFFLFQCTEKNPSLDVFIIASNSLKQSYSTFLIFPSQAISVLTLSCGEVERPAKSVTRLYLGQSSALAQRCDIPTLYQSWHAAVSASAALCSLDLQPTSEVRFTRMENHFPYKLPTSLLSLTVS